MSLSSKFMWGGSIAAHQCEGAWNEGNKGLGIMDLVSKGSSTTPRHISNELEEGIIYPSHTGIDFYHQYEKDIQLFAEMGFNTLRISIDWSRIYSNGDDEYPNQEGLQYYHNVIDTLLANHIEPIVTLYHFELPHNIVKKYNSWLNRKTIELYLKFVGTVVREYHTKVHKWVTFNEMNHLDPMSEASDIFTYMIAGVKYSEMKNPKQDLALIGYNMTLAGCKAYELIKSIDETIEVGCVFGITAYYPKTCKPMDVMKAFKMMERDYYQIDAMVGGSFPQYKIDEFKQNGIELIISEEDQQAFKKSSLDFIGINYYASEVCAEIVDENDKSYFGGLKNPYLEQSKWGWTIDPVGLRYVLNYTYKKYKLPIMITENGLGAVDVLEDGKVHDSYRIDYLKKHLKALKDAVELDEVDCLGYLMWGPIDLVSATTGEMKKRYGFIYVNKTDDNQGDYSRIKKDSFNWYKEVISSNGEILD